MQSSSTEISAIDESQDGGFELLDSKKLTGITSYSVSPTRVYMLITTVKGFAICYLMKSQYECYQNEKSPFFRNTNAPHGIKLGSILQTRAQVALVPNFNSKKYQDTCIYIYDYGIRIILSKFNFHLNISQFSLTETFLIVSNNKRIVLYNYLKSHPEDSEDYYLTTYKSNQNIDFIKYIDMFCHLYDQNNPRVCECGCFAFAHLQKYLQLFYIKVSNINNNLKRMLYFYNQKTDKSKVFYQGPLIPNHKFHFTVSDNAKYLIYTENLASKLNVYNLMENCLFAVLSLGSTVNILNIGVITITAPANKGDWVICSCDAQDYQCGIYHMFKLVKQPPTEPIYSNYRRFFRLFRNIIRDEQIFANADTFLGPEHYLKNQQLYSVSLLGEYCKILQFARVGLHPQGKTTANLSLEQINQKK